LLRETELRRQQHAGSKLGGGGYEGTLFKKPTKISAYLSWSGWRRRFCVVDDEGFRYYGKQGDAEPRGTMLFSDDCNVVRGGRVDQGMFGFDLVASNIVHSFASADERAVAIWADVLELKIRQASLRKTHPLRHRSSLSLRSSLKSSSINIDADSESDDLLFEATGKVPIQWVNYRIHSANSSALWQSMDTVNGTLVSHRLPCFAGNSSTDASAWMDQLWGMHEVKATMVVQASAASLFAALMDLSTCRSNWDDTFIEGAVLKVTDIHNDEISMSFKTLSAKRVMRLNRYWGRAAGGVYTIFCFSYSPPVATNKFIECNVSSYQITISPGDRMTNSSYSTVCHRLCMNPCGWAPYLPTYARRLSSELVVQISGLSRLFSGSKYFPFEGRLLQGIQAADVKFEDSGALVSILRDISSATDKVVLEDLKVTKTIVLAQKSLTKVPLPVVKMKRRYATPKNNYILPKAISKDGSSMWWDSGTDAGYWKLRGPGYLTDKVKINSAVSAMELVQMQWSFVDEPIRNIASREGELVQNEHEGRSDREFMLVINFMVPTIGNWACYFLRREGQPDPTFDRLLKRFIEEDDEYRNSRFKIIPSVVDGSYLAKKGIGNTPAILGKKIKCEYFHGSNWFEVCVDVGSSRVAGSLMGLVKSYAATLVIDLAFLIEAQTVEELPERLIGGARMYKPLMYPIDNVSSIAASEELYQESIAPTPITISIELPQEEVVLSPILKHSSPKVCEALNYEYRHTPENRLVQKAKAKIGQSYWIDSGAQKGLWVLRGKTYFQNRLKVSSGVSAMEMLQCELVFNDQPKSHIAAAPGGFVQMQHTKHRPFMLVVNFMVPELANFVCYFAKRRNSDQEDSKRFDEVLRDFVELGDQYRNKRFKVLPSVVEGYFVASQAIGKSPVIVGKQLSVDYFSGKNYFEICVDLSKSRIACDLFEAIRSYASSLVVDIGFVIEAQENEELPEILLGGVRLVKPLTFAMSQEEFENQYVK